MSTTPVFKRAMTQAEVMAAFFKYSVAARGHGFLLDAMARGFTAKQAEAMMLVALRKSTYSNVICVAKGGVFFAVDPWPSSRNPKSWVYKQSSGEWNDAWISKNIPGWFG